VEDPSPDPDAPAGAVPDAAGPSGAGGDAVDVDPAPTELLDAAEIEAWEALEDPDEPEDPDAFDDEVDAPVEVPLVQAVVVACDPGPTFSATLASLAAQDYPALSIVVVDTGSRDVEAVEQQVRAVLPGARVVRRTDRNVSLAVNHLLDEGATAPFLLVVHDDVRLDPDATRLLVEETFRSNAGIAGAKLVDWDEPDRLLQVGMSIDKTGWPASLVDRGELDQEQHDAVRDVSTCPAGARSSAPTCSGRSAASTRSCAWRARTSTCAGGPTWPAPGCWWPRRPGPPTGRPSPSGPPPAAGAAWPAVTASGPCCPATRPLTWSASCPRPSCWRRSRRCSPC
jgi:hypothetical protein